MRRLFLKGKKKLISEFITALKGRKEIPLKFEYLGKGAKRWDDLVKTEEYELGKIELKLINSNIQKLFFYFGNKKLNLIDVGCGNGMKSIPFIKKLSKTYKLVYYAIIDISKEMIGLASNNIKKYIKSPIKIYEYNLDFEAGNFAQITRNLRNVGYQNNLLLLLGNTIGNPFDKYRLLVNLRESMTLSDYLIIGTELLGSRKISNILRHYKNETIYKIQFGSLESLGIKRNDGYFDVVYNKGEYQVETYFVFDKDRSIIYGGEKIHFEKGDKILLMISHKFIEVELINLLNKSGFKILDSFTGEGYIIILCKPKSL